MQIYSDFERTLKAARNAPKPGESRVEYENNNTYT